MEFDNSINKLQSEILLNNGKLNKVIIKDTLLGDHGIYSTSNINIGDILIEIPYNKCISIDKILSSSLSIIFEENNDILNYTDEVLCIGLMYALKNPNCEWRDHVDTMPKSYDLTFNWKPNEIEFLRGSMLFHLTGMMLRQIQSDWSNLHFPISQNYPELLPNITIEDYKWALSTVYSRAIGFTRQGQYIRCIVPLIDMANHHPVAYHPTIETFGFSEIDDNILFISTKEYQPNEECYACYGNYSNSKLLYTYGFTLSSTENCPRAIDMWSSLSPNIPYYKEKNQVLQSNELTKQQTYDFTGTLRNNGWISRALITTIRVIQTSIEEFPHIMKAYQKNQIISIRNERASYISLLELLDAKLKQLNERLRSEEAFHIDESNQSRRRWNMVQQVLHEDQITIQECFERVNKWILEIDELGELFKPHDSENISD